MSTWHACWRKSKISADRFKPRTFVCSSHDHNKFVKFIDDTEIVRDYVFMNDISKMQ